MDEKQVKEYQRVLELIDGLSGNVERIGEINGITIKVEVNIHTQYQTRKQQGEIAIAAKRLNYTARRSKGYRMIFLDSPSKRICHYIDLEKETEDQED